MAVDVLERLRRENPATDLPDLDAGALFAQIVAEPRDVPAARVPRLSRRRLAIALAVVLAVAAPLALAASTTHVLDFVFGKQPPKQVRQMFENMFPPAYGPKEGPQPQGATRKDLIRSSERMVAQITTSSGTVARLWAADLRTGGTCFVALGRPFGGGSCFGPNFGRKYPLAAPSGASGRRPPGSFGAGVTLFGRATSPRAASLAVYYKDGSTQVVHLTHGWFLYEVPKAHERWGHEPTRIDILDASGQVIATQNDPFSLHGPPVPKAEKPVGPQRLLARESLGWKGAFLELQSATGDRGHQCVRVLNTGDRVQTGGWWCDPAIGTSAPVSEGSQSPPKPVFFELHQFTKFGKPGGYVYARGWVGPQVASLEIRFQDSTVRKLALHERLFLYVVPADHWPLGKRPSYVIGRDRSGRIVYRRFLYPRGRCAYPVADARCAKIIVHNG